jgi:hypothetical protein
VPQGQYTVVARSSGGVMAIGPPPGANGPAIKLTATAPGNQSWAMADVTTDNRGSSMVTLNLQPGMSVAGRVVFEGAAAPPDLSRFRLAMAPVGRGGFTELAGGIRPAGVDADGRFTFVGVVPGRYRITLSSTGGLGMWVLKSALAGAQDVLDLPLEVKPGENVGGLTVTMSTRRTELSGTLQSPTGQPIGDYTIVAFSSDQRHWTPQSRRIQATRPATDGRFSFRDLPAGDYRMAAVSDVENGQWFDPAFLRQLIGASMTVTIGEGERRIQDVRVAGR